MNPDHKIRVLSLEDTPSDAELQLDVLRRSGLDLEWRCVDTEPDFHTQVREFQPHVILADYNLPTYNGSEALAHVRAVAPQIPVIIVTGTIGEVKAVQLMKGGAQDYILKDRLARLPEALNHALTAAKLARERRDTELKLLESERRLKDSLVDFVAALASIVEMRDPYTAGHQRRVANLAVSIAEEMELPENVVEGIRLGGMIHDIGKIRVPAEILSKPGRLSPIEYQMIQQHAMAGYEILKNGDFPWPIALMILQHHERLDGSGYPQALHGDQIIIEAKILAVADVVEAIASHRPYRPGLGVAAALEEIDRGRGTVYESTVVDACNKLFKEKSYVISV